MSITSGTLIRRPRLLIADDHALLREAFQKLLEADCDIVGSVADGRSLVTLAPKVNPDVILLDIAMPLLNGVDAALQLKRSMPLVKHPASAQSFVAQPAHPDCRALASGISQAKLSLLCTVQDYREPDQVPIVPREPNRCSA